MCSHTKYPSWRRPDLARTRLLFPCLLLWLPLPGSGSPALAASGASPGPERPAAERALSGRARPALDVETLRQQGRKRVSRLTDQAIEVLRRLLAITPDSDPEKPDLLFRLATHYREKQLEAMFAARELDEAIFAARERDRTALRSRQQELEKQERDWMIKATRMYLLLASNPSFSTYRRLDEALFNLADLLNKAGRPDKARLFFGALIRNHPQSRYIPDAYLSFAEHYFNGGRVQEALRLYQQVGRYPHSSIHGYAVYKQGWCWLNLRDPKKALEKFVTVIKRGGTTDSPRKSRIVLVKEARKDSVRAYSQVGTPEKAWPFFQRIGGTYAPRMLERLANLYYDQGKFLDSIQVFRQLIALFSQSKDLCAWQRSIVKSTLSTGDRDSQVVEAGRLAAVYEAVEKRGGMKKTALAGCRQNASGVLRELAITWHREAMTTKSKETFGQAEQLYRQYLALFPREKDAYEMTYNLAELLFARERWEPAAEIYSQVVTMDPRGAHLADAAHAGIICWRNIDPDEDSGPPTPSARSPQASLTAPFPLPPLKQKMMRSLDLYLTHVPRGPEWVTVLYRKARLDYDHNHHEEAMKGFSAIVVKHPGHKLAVYAANLFLDSLNILKRYAELNRWVDRLMKDSRLARGKFLEQLRTIKRGAQRKEAEQLQKSGRFKECGEKYAIIANEYQHDPRWSEVLYNAAICFEAAKLIGHAINIRSTLIKIKPDDPLARKALYMIGANYHALAWYSHAADYYEQFARKYPGEKESPEALQNAIVFRLGRGELDKAVEDSRLFEKSYGPRRQLAARTASIIFSLGAIYENRKDPEAMVKHYDRYLKKWGRHGGVDRQIQAHVKIGEVLWRQSCPGSGVNGACIRMTRVRSKRLVEKKTRGKKRRRHKKRGVEIRTQCGPQTKMKVIVLDRDRLKSRKAQSHFTQALTLYRRARGGKAIKGESQEERERRMMEMSFAAAAARFYQAEAMLEGFLAVKFPTDLDFSEGRSIKQRERAERSKREFARYLQDKSRKLESTRTVYQEVILMKVAHWAIAASARIGQLFQNFADALYTAPIPRPSIPRSLTRDADREYFVMAFTDTYCDTLEDEAGPLEAKAVQGLDTCLRKSTELSWYNEWSSLCEAELNQIKPAEYPIAAEIRARPGYVSFRTDRAGLIAALR